MTSGQSTRKPPLLAEEIAVSGGLLGMALVAWWFTFLPENQSMDMMSFGLNLPRLAAFASTWTVGMFAMMFPTVVPMMLLFVRSGKMARPEVRAGGGPTTTRAAVFAATYITIWAAAGVAFYLGLSAVQTLSGVPEFFATLTSPLGAGIALILTGLYQLSPIKGECLDRCHPTAFLFRYYRGGLTGAFSMGLMYAKYCVGCCWVMMLFLLLVAAMGPIWMVLFASLIFAERAFFHSRWPARLIGAGFALAGLARIFI